MLSLALQGIVMAAVLLYTSKKLSSNRWIALIIFSISWCTLSRVMVGGLQNDYPWLVLVFYLPAMLIGPFIYFYTRELLYGDKKLKAGDVWHFLPAVKGAGPQIGFLFFYSGSLYQPFIRNMYFTKAAQFILFDVHPLSNLPTALSLISYSALSYLVMNKDQANTSLSVYKLSDIKWLKNLLHLFLGLTLLFIITIVINLGHFAHGRDFINCIFFVPLIAFTYWLGISTYLRQSKMSAAEIVTYNKVPAKVYFSEHDATVYEEKLTELMTKDHLYLDPLLKLDTLARRLNITERAISNLLNQHVGKNFNDFVNEYRIEAAKLKLADPTFDQYTIAAISYECGFNSLATFQRCFKQFAGITPSQFIQHRKDASPLMQQQ